MGLKRRCGVLEVKCSSVAAKIDVLLGVRSLTVLNILICLVNHPFLIYCSVFIVLLTLLLY